MQFKTSLYVRSYDTDFTGVVHHASYLIYFEQARNEAFREIGVVYEELDSIGCMIAITRAAQAYKAPAFYDDLLTVSTQITKFNSFFAAFEYAVTRGSDEIATGETELVFLTKNVSPEELPSPFRIPRSILERVKPYLEP